MIAGVLDFGAWQAAVIAIKAITYGAGLAAAGSVFFLILFHSQLSAGEQRRTARLAIILAVTAGLATAVHVPILAGMLGGRAASMLDWPLIGIVLETGAGAAAVIRITGILLMAGVATGGAKGRAVGGIGGFLFCLSLVWTGHAAAIGPGVLPRVLLTVHLLAVAYWLGAFVPLRRLTRESDIPRIAGIMKRFGQIAAWGVAGLLLAGTGLLWLLLDEPAALVATGYGRFFLLKIGLVVGLLALAAINKFRLVPRLQKGDSSGLVALRRSITVEMIVAGLVLVVTAVFTTVSGPPVLE